jgi:hypothetical protein
MAVRVSAIELVRRCAQAVRISLADEVLAEVAAEFEEKGYGSLHPDDQGIIITGMLAERARF